MGSNEAQSKAQDCQNNEIFLSDILGFIKSIWKTSVFFAIAGLGLSIGYLANTPKRYEAVSQIAMAQISSTTLVFNPIGINIEEPQSLIARLTYTASFMPQFNQQVLAACGLQNYANEYPLLGRSIEARFKLTVPKGSTNLVVLKAFDSNPQVAKECNLAVFEYIKTTQSELIKSYIEEVKIKLVDNEERLQKSRDRLASESKSSLEATALYLATRDEMRFLLEEISKLKNIVNVSLDRNTRLLSPIYTNEITNASKALQILMIGLFGGLFLGLFIAIIRKEIARLKSEPGGVL